MAKRAVLTHTKFKKLCRKLDVPEYAALGILEALWHLTSRETYRGNIGKLSNEDIAAAIDWRGDEDALIQALIDCRWLDEHPEYRLIVHDWKDHADDTTKKAISRNGETFIAPVGSMPGNVATSPDIYSLPEPEPEPEPEPRGATSRDKSSRRPDCLETAEAFFLEHGSSKVEAAKFWNFYESKGWKVGRNPMERWKAAASNWMSRANEFAGSNGRPPRKEVSEQEVSQWTR